jgi:hypothetical protein
VHPTQLSLFAAVKKRQSNVPVFLIYAGIIHAIGLALLLPMLITLPGPGREGAPESAAIDVEIIPAAPLAGKIEPDGDQTSALPSGEASSGEAAKPDGARDGVAAVDIEARPEEAPDAALPEDADAKNAGAQTKDTAEPLKPAKASTAKPAKKAVAVRRSASPAGRRAARKDAKIAPFNGALTGLFSPGAPAKRR